VVAVAAAIRDRGGASNTTSRRCSINPPVAVEIAAVRSSHSHPPAVTGIGLVHGLVQLEKAAVVGVVHGASGRQEGRGVVAAVLA